MVRVISVLTLVFFLAPAAQTEIISKRDTLHFTDRAGDYVRFFAETNQFDVMEIDFGGRLYSCTTSVSCDFFVVAGAFPTCPCCPKTTLGATRRFWTTHQSNLAQPLNINDSQKFRIVNYQGYGSQCSFPISTVETTSSEVSIFEIIRPSKPRLYMVVRPIKVYFDRNIPYYSAPGGMNYYPPASCDNQLIVDIHVQTNGSLDFTGIEAVRVSRGRTRGMDGGTTAPKSAILNLQGRVITRSADHGKPTSMIPGCYLVQQEIHKRAGLLVISH